MWNYRVLETNNGLQIHEVYYNKEGEIILHSVEGVLPYGETKEELLSDFHYMLAALEKPVLKMDEIKFAKPDWEDEEE